MKKLIHFYKFLFFLFLSAVFGIVISLLPVLVNNVVPMQKALKSADTKVLMDSFEGEYYYSNLTEPQKQAFALVYQGLLRFEEEITIPVISNDDFHKVFEAITYDKPDLFFIGNTASFKSTLMHCTYLPKYLCTKDEYNIMAEELNAVTEELLTHIPTDCDDFYKEKIVHDLLVSRIEYEKNEWDSSVYGALVKGKAVCSGYARSTEYLLDRVGVKSYVVTGTAGKDGGTEGHMWNTVFINSLPYYLDVTWDDGYYSEYGANYDYFNVTEEQIKITHTPELPESNGCNYIDSNYYVHENLYFDSIDENFHDSVFEIFKAYVLDGEPVISLAFATDEDLNDAVSILIYDNVIFDILYDIRTYASLHYDTEHLKYSVNEDLKILTFNIIR